MKRVFLILVSYGVFLILVGVAGYLSNPEKAKTALMSGGLFGAMSIGFGVLARRGWRPARKAGLIMAAFLGLVFIWRSSVSWMAVADGQSEKVVAASLISSMLLGTIIVVFALMSRKVREDESDPAQSSSEGVA